MGGPLKVSVNFRSHHRARVTATLRDTKLLVPADGDASRSLEAISETTSLKKIDLPRACKAHMDRVADPDPALFESYAMNDVRVCLEYYLNFMRDFEAMFLGAEGMPMTMGGAAVAAYKQWLAESPVLTLNKVRGKAEMVGRNIWGGISSAPTPVKSREYTEALAQDALMGGLNMAYQTGRVLAGPDDVILDLDFAGAYAAAMANLPTIDWDAARLDSSMPPPDAADLPIQFYNIEFSFPEDERYPTQAVRFPDGLCFPLHGETTCTGVEVELARGLGASIKVRHALYLPPLRDADGAVAPAFASFIADLTQRRNKEPKDSLRNRIFKGIINSFYGKLAQGIDGAIPHSAITCPHYAAMTTGIIRAALASLVVTISRLPGWRVLSATTDGAMVIGPRRFPIRVVEEGRKRGQVITDGPKFDELYPGVFEALREWSAIRPLERGRRNMGLKDPRGWLEIKHVGTEAATYLTRVYALRHEGVDQHVAWTGFSTRQRTGEEMMEYGADPEPRSKHIGRLTSYREIMEGEVIRDVVIGKSPDGEAILGDLRVCDMINIKIERRASLDYDMKRVQRLDGSGETDPPPDVEAVIEMRRLADAVRGRGRGKGRDARRATPEALELARHKVRLRGDTARVIRRHVIRGILQNMSRWFPRRMTLQELSARSGLTVNQLKQHKRTSSTAHALPDTPETRRIIEEVAVMFGVEATEERLQTLLLPGRAQVAPALKPAA